MNLRQVAVCQITYFVTFRVGQADSGPSRTRDSESE